MKKSTVKYKPKVGKCVNPHKKCRISRERKAQKEIVNRMIGNIL